LNERKGYLSNKGVEQFSIVQDWWIDWEMVLGLNALERSIFVMHNCCEVYGWVPLSIDVWIQAKFARFVACGYSQVPGVDFNESFAPVINDIRFCVMLIIKLIWGLHATIIDVKTAFLHGDPQEEMYMNIPDGLESNGNECLRWKKIIYGLVHSVREFYKKLIEVLKVVGFVENNSDPCLW
jgi:Reverse transcriptase (RNA-dependent DNA polymerase)